MHRKAQDRDLYSSGCRIFAMTKASNGSKLAIVPAFSVMLEPGQQVIPTERDGESRVKVRVSSNISGGNRERCIWRLPVEWKAEPAQVALEFHRRGEKQEVEFKVYPASLKEGRANIRAASSQAELITARVTASSRARILTAFYYYQPALQRISIVDVKVPQDLNVGYVMGAGDDIPTVLQQIGMKVTLIPADKIASKI